MNEIKEEITETVETGTNDFTGWEDEDTSPIFEAEESEEETEVEKTEEELAKENETKSKKAEREAQEKIDNEFDFEKENTEAETAIETADKDTDNNQSTPIINSLNYLKDKGFLDYELDNEEELTEEKAAELIEENFDVTVNERVEEMIKDLPPALKEMTKFSLNGGDINILLSQYGKGGKMLENLDMTLPTNQELVMKVTLDEEGYDEETIKGQIDYFKDAGKLAETSEKRYEKWNTKRVADNASVLENQRLAKVQEEDDWKEYKEKIVKVTAGKDPVNGIKLTRRERVDIPNYVGVANVKLANGRRTTQFRKDLSEAMRNPEKLVALAKIIKGDFNFKSLISDIETKVISATQKKIKDTKTLTPKSGGGGSNRGAGSGKSLADLL